MRTWQDWETVHQPYELRYHIEQGIEWCRDDERFDGFWDQIFDFIEVRGECLDVGCGPRPPFGKHSTAVDPLAVHYRQLVPDWWEQVESHSLPAERFVTGLAGRFDTVLCWNCLDHTIGWKQILMNLSKYGKKGATYGIATDFGPPAKGHPGLEREDFFDELQRHFNITNYAENFQERDVALVLK